VCLDQAFETLLVCNTVVGPGLSGWLFSGSWQLMLLVICLTAGLKMVLWTRCSTQGGALTIRVKAVFKVRAA
jgi:hypothetical protein